MADTNGEGMSFTVLAETENYSVVLGEYDEGETMYNVELASVTLHLFQEEWEELVELINAAQHK